jgi:ABC-type transporter Mla maintaining outer membrane lipid asymmetry permease subunit MlaE
MTLDGAVAFITRAIWIALAIGWGAIIAVQVADREDRLGAATVGGFCVVALVMARKCP